MGVVFEWPAAILLCPDADVLVRSSVLPVLPVVIANVMSVASMPNAVVVAAGLAVAGSIDSPPAVAVCPADDPIRRCVDDDDRGAGLVERPAVEPLDVERGAVGVVLGVEVGVGDGDVLVAAVVVTVAVDDVVSVASAAAAADPAGDRAVKIANANARTPAIPAVTMASAPAPARAPSPLGATRRLSRTQSCGPHPGACRSRRGPFVGEVWTANRKEPVPCSS